MQNKKILITGGTGSFGYKATQKFLQAGAEVIIYSRDEYKQALMKKEFPDAKFCIGDVRDLERLQECTQGVAVIIHAAAMKHVDICEQNSSEAFKTNVLGSKNVVAAALSNDVPVIINLSADKAVYPAGIYGESKAESEKIFVEGARKAKVLGKPCRFSNLRYSNVLSSRGSVVEIFEKILQDDKTVTVFDDKMIRLVLTQNQVISLVEFTINNSLGGETYLIKSPVLRISDLATAMQQHLGKGKVEIKNEIREGEKYDAVLLSAEESRRTLITTESYLVILPEFAVSLSGYHERYGDNYFAQGEYGTHNAQYLNNEEIIKMVYEESDELYNQHNNHNTEKQGTADLPALEGGTPVRDTHLPYATQWTGEEEKKEILEVLESGWLTTGPKVQQFETDIAEYLGAKYAIALNSGTAALHCCVGALDIGPGDEVITTPFTFLATANAIVYVGATPVLVDVEEDTYNIDPEEIRKKITPRTKAIIPVHYGGHPCNMDEIKKIAEEYDLKVIEDAAHALSTEYKGQKIGTHSDMVIFSFHPVKNITTAEGGIITTNDEELAKRCVMHRTHGITKEAMERYGKDANWTYDMQRLGHRYNMTEFQAALGVAQLKKIGFFQQRREGIVDKYQQAFSSMPELILPTVKDYAKSSWHLFPIRIREEMLNADRNKMIKALKAENIGVNVHYIPIHMHTYYQKNFGFKEGDFPKAEKIYSSIITLPLFPKMSEQDADDVIKAVRKTINYYRR